MAGAADEVGAAVVEGIGVDIGKRRSASKVANGVG
jgi:hypothetical protein